MTSDLETLRRGQILDVYEVQADAKTGEWIGEPSFTGQTVNAWDWAHREDTEQAHFDTYVYDVETQAERAIIVRWAK